MRVLIAGAGIGGLVLAHGLRTAGIEVEVHERDDDLASTAGYRLHLDGPAVDVLGRLIPVKTFEAVLASAAGAESFSQFAVLDRRMRLVVRLPLDGPPGDLLIGRRPLRTLLTRGLDDCVCWGSTVHSARIVDGGQVRVTVEPGPDRTVDLMVAADGARSSIANTLAGAQIARRLRAWGLAGRSALTAPVRESLPADLKKGPAFAAGPGGTLLFLSTHDAANTAAVAKDPVDLGAIVEEPFVLWGFTIAHRPFIGQPNPARLLATARGIASTFSPEVNRLVGGAQPDSVAAYRYYAADPAVPMSFGQAGPITAIGDAVHPMPPTGGRGAATAIRDAGELTDALARAARAEITPVDAIRQFQLQMIGYATAAVRESLEPLRAQRYLRGPAVSMLTLAGAMRGQWRPRS